VSSVAGRGSGRVTGGAQAGGGGAVM
jgi:hypothetical protein